MREIKFRAFDKMTGKMIVTGFHIFGEYTLFNIIGQYLFETKGDREGSLERYNDVEVMQFTGLLDKNGKEIYDQDIVRVDDKVMLVQMLEGCWRTKYQGFANYRLYGWVEGALEVVGNQFENPELLQS